MSAEEKIRNFKRIKYEEDALADDEVHAVIYARYSTENQLNTSTKDQLSAIRRAVDTGEVKSLLYPNSKIIIKYQFNDDAVSGDSMIGRDGFQNAMALMRTGEAKLLIVYDFKRGIRGMGLALSIYDELVEAGAELFAVSDGFSSASKNARLQFMSKAFGSEEFLAGISSDTKRGLNERRYEGFSDGHLWYGVASRPTRKIEVKGRKKDSYFDYFVVPSLAENVLRIFNLANTGHSQKDIAKILNSEGLPPPSAYDKHGNIREFNPKRKIWRDRTIYQILHNNSYRGIIERGKTKQIKRSNGTKQTVKIPRSSWMVIEREDLRIIPEDLWLGVQERFKEYNRKKFQNLGEKKQFKYEGTTNNVLTALFICDCCKGPIVTITRRRGGYYGCRNSYKNGTTTRGGCRNRKLIHKSKIEPVIFSWLVNQLMSDELCAALARRYNELRRMRSSGDEKELSQREERLEEVELALKNILAAIESGTTSGLLLDRLAVLETEQLKLMEKIKYLRGLDQSEVYITASGIKQRFGELPSLLQGAQPFEVNRALRPLFSRNGGVVLQKRLGPEGKDHYWAVGSVDLGLALGLGGSQGLSGSVVLSEPVLLELQLD